MYTRINWIETTPLNATNLNKMETQYDEVMADIGAVRQNINMELRLQIVLTDPAGVVGAMIYNQSENSFKYFDGTTWQTLAVEGSEGL